MFKTDGGGLATKANIKVSLGASTWNTRLSQIVRMGPIYICTYSLPNQEYLDKIFSKRSHDITILAHKNFYEKALALKRRYPDLRIFTADEVHAKMVLIGPEKTWLSSANFGSSGWLEHTAGIESKEVYDYYLRRLLHFIEKNGREVL